MLKAKCDNLILVGNSLPEVKKREIRWKVKIFIQGQIAVGKLTPRAAVCRGQCCHSRNRQKRGKCFSEITVDLELSN